MKTDPTIEKEKAPNQTRAVRLMLSGSRCLAVFAEEIESISDWHPPTPLPDAPPSVLGVTSIRGHMFTVLDAAILLGEAPLPPGKIVALRGNEQLALAVSSCGEMIEITSDALESASKVSPVILGFISQNEQSVAVLDGRHLFATAMRGRERRRRRFLKV